MKVANRAQIDPFYVMEAFREAAQVSATGADVLHLSLGQPADRPPKDVLEYAASQALEDPLGYTDARGMPVLRDRIADHYAQQYRLEVPPDRIFVTVGSSSAYFMALLAAFDVGDRVALVSPHYPATPNMMRALGVEPVIMRSTMEDNYQPTLAMLQALDEVPNGLVIASPSNPTGTVIDPDELAEIIKYCEANNIRIISDEIYHGVSYGGDTKSVLELSDNMIVNNSFSKYYLLPGWRLGWAVMPEDLCRSVESLLQNFFISPPAVSQYAALKVMDCRDQLDEIVVGYKNNRDTLLEGLPKAGIDRLAPAQGAFYLYADVSHLTNDSVAFCHKMLEEAHVCAVPGLDFDKGEGHRYVRFSYSGARADIKEACDRLQRWLA